METYRELIDGHYWFPTYSYADEELIFDNGQPLHIRMKVRYSDFAKGHSRVVITGGGGPPEPTPRRLSLCPLQLSHHLRRRRHRQHLKSKPRRWSVAECSVAKTIELPDPEYPEEARRTRAGGRVIISVIVDETGKVISAEVEDGPIIFRRVAMEAARKARFKPTLVDGQPVKVSGILQYRFAP